jgi:hypothetical protein
MSISKRFRACIITFTLLLSILSFSVCNINKVKAEDEFGDLETLYNLYASNIHFENILHPHPYRYVGVWECNETITVEGDITFELYFTSPFLTQIELLDYQDNLNISVYLKNKYDNLTLLKNGNKTIELNPSDFLELIQKYTIKLENLNQTIMEDESLIFVIEVIQSEKPTSDLIAKRIETKTKNRLLKIADSLQKSDDEELVEIGLMIENIIFNITDITEGLGFNEEEIASLFNVLFSSAFYYGSGSYASSVKFFTSEGENKTIYFKNEYSEFQSDLQLLGILHEKVMNENKPNAAASYSWPPIASALIEEIDLENETYITDLFSWFVAWAVYTIGEIEYLSENRVTYYLHKDRVMNKVRPEESTTIRDDLSTEPLKWTASPFERNKILENVTAELYIYFPKILTLGTVEINVTLKNGNKTIASDTKEVDSTNLIELLKRGPDSPTVFYLDKFKEDQIWHDKDINLEISVSEKPALSLLRSAKINYDSTNYPSSLTLRYRETDNIQMEGFEDKLVYAGGNAEYVFNVTSNYEDTVDITAEAQESVGEWSIEYYPKSVKIGEKGSATIHLFVNSTATDDSAYKNKDAISLLINATGETGFSSKPTNVSVSLEAVEYNIEIIKPEGLEIKHGSEATYQFIIRNRNKGFVKDTYVIEVTSEHNLSLAYNNGRPYIGTQSKPIDVYNEQDDEPIEAILNVTVTVPWYTDVTSDILTFNITSKHSLDYLNKYYKETTVTTKIVTPNILESLYKLFESAANKIGLSGPIAGWILIGAVFVLLLIIIIILALIRRRKFADLICLERIKEITPDEKAEFEITVKNPYNSVLTYEFKTLIDSSTNSFDVSLDTTQAIVESKQSTKIKLIVKPTDYVKKDDWIEVKVVAKALDKKKPGKISTVTTIKDSETKVDISGVFHWPRIFKKGDRVETSFKLINRGNVSARNISVILYVNGEEKNKVEDITIPRGGYADIAIPWVAVKGKNEVYIVVK